MTRETKVFKNKTDGYNGEAKLAMKRKNQPARNFKHFEDVGHQDPWEIARETGENWRDELDSPREPDEFISLEDPFFDSLYLDADEYEYPYVPFY